MLRLLSTARSKILVELKTRPHTISELSKITGYSKPTIAYHLDKLNDAGYVKRIERGKWVYYSLTKSGLDALKYEIAKMGFLLIGGLTSLIYGIISVIGWKANVVKPLKEMPKKPEAFYINIMQYIPYLAIMIGLLAVFLFLILKFRNVPLKSQ